RRSSRLRWTAKASFSTSTRPRLSPPISERAKSRPEPDLFDALRRDGLCKINDIMEPWNNPAGSPVTSALIGQIDKNTGARDELVGRFTYRREYIVRLGAWSDYRRVRDVRRANRCSCTDDSAGLI